LEDLLGGLEELAVSVTLRIEPHQRCTWLDGRGVPGYVTAVVVRDWGESEVAEQEGEAARLTE
jgi:hypothetical protein